MKVTTDQPCESCGKPVAGFESVSLGSIEDGYRHLCMACYNATISEHTGVDFEHHAHVDIARIFGPTIQIGG